MTGQLFGDRYQVGDTLGFGGMSEVHRGRDLRLGRDVAVKVLRADLARDPSFQVRFRREAQNAASLNHPAIVAVYDTGESTSETGPVPYIVMEYVDGETLRDLLKREGPLPPRRVMEIVADVCAALDFSHRHGIVHRDIKPANIMLTRAGAVKVMDFGIARAVADGQSTMTATAAVIGTAQYLSPEQARGESVDARSDVYSTGCVLFELLTGAPPFSGDSPVAVAYQHVREDPKPPSATKPGLPRELDAIVLKALNKNPLNRYQTAAEMRSDLVRALAGQPVQAPRVMDDDERTRLMNSAPEVAPQRIPAATPPILAPPQRALPDHTWEEEPTNSRAKKVWGYIGIGAICMALLAGAVFLTVKFTSAPTTPKDVTTPNLRGMTQEQAAKALTDVGFKLGQVDPKASTDQEIGKVIKQNPSGGTPRQPGTVVNIEIGSGVAKVQVPNLATLSEGDAKKKLDSLGLLTKVNPVPSTLEQKDSVVGQDPPTDTTLKVGQTVTINIGTGPNQVVVPNIAAGTPLSDATKSLTDAKLQSRTEAARSTLEKDKVLKFGEGHQAGEKVDEGTVITLIVSDGSQFEIPSIVNMTKDAAAQQLRAKGWEGDASTLTEVETVPVTVDQVGLILKQDPAAGSLGNKVGQPIQISVGVIKKITMPDLRGRTLSEAQGLLAQAGWASTLSPQTIPGNPPENWANRIQAQDVSPNSWVDYNVAVKVNVYGSPPPPTTNSAPPGGTIGSSTATIGSIPPQQPTANPTPTVPPPGGGNGNGNGNGGRGNG